jgi:hypothetical protein
VLRLVVVGFVVPQRDRQRGHFREDRFRIHAQDRW